jgi:hypothetical protein
VHAFKGLHQGTAGSKGCGCGTGERSGQTDHDESTSHDDSTPHAASYGHTVSPGNIDTSNRANATNISPSTGVSASATRHCAPSPTSYYSTWYPRTPRMGTRQVALNGWDEYVDT